MPRQPKGPCQHGWALPDDGWALREQLNAIKLVMRCRLCGQSRVEVYEYGRWKPLVQLGFFTAAPKEPLWHEDFVPDILKEDWDWSK